MAHTSMNLQFSAISSRAAIAGAGLRLPCAPAPCRVPLPAVRLQARRPAVVAMSSAAGDYSEAEKRWNEQLADGKVRNVSASNAADMVKEGWTLLDVRPPNEVEKAPLVDAVTVPVFVLEDKNDIEAILKKSSAFGMGGWWLGGSHMKANTNFMRDVQKAVSKDSKVIVSCQKGLRSLAAAEQMSRAGYQTLAWINGGLDTAGGGALPTTNGKDVRYGGIGGVSQLLGWTDVQRAEDKDNGIDKGSIFIKVGGAVLLADAALFAWEFFQAWQNNTIPPSALR